MAPRSTDLNDAKLAERVVEFWRDGDKALMDDRRQFWLNYAFYRGHQWLWWDPARRVVQTASEADSGTTRVRTTVNKIQPRLDGLIGRLAQTDLSFEVPPTATDEATISGASIGESVLAAEHDDQDWEWTRTENLYNTFFGGTAAVGLSWNPNGGLWRTDNDQIIDGGDGGRVDLRAYSIAEFTIEPGSRRPQDSTRWATMVRVPPSEAREHYQLGYTPDPDIKGAIGGLHAMSMRDRGLDSNTPLVNVFTYYERPCDENRGDGIVAVVVGDKIVARDKWPFPFNDLNVRVFRQKPIPGQWTGTTLLNAARNPQVLYNAVRSIITEHIKLAGNARMMVPVGSLTDDADLTDEAGEIVEYFPQDGAAPFYMAPAALPRYVYNEPANLEAELDDIMATNEVARGVAPGDRNSGAALALLAERNDTPLGLMARDQAQGWADLASKTLRLYASNTTTPRRAVVWHDGVAKPVHWNGESFQDQFRVKVPLESTTPTSKAARTAQLVTMKQNFPEVFTNLDARTVADMIDMPGAKSSGAIVNADARRAQKENELIASDEVIEPQPYDDHARHIAEHNRYRKSDRYIYAEPEMRRTLDLHVEAHQRLLEEEAAQQAAINAVQPGLAAIPQANEPIGSAVPPDVAEEGLV